MRAHVKVVDRWEEGLPTPVPTNAKIQAHNWGGKVDPFFTAVYVDDFLLVRVQHADDDRTALTASASLASDHVRLFGPGEEGATPILAPKKSTDWDTTIDALGFTVNSHTLRTSITREQTEATKRLLFDNYQAAHLEFSFPREKPKQLRDGRAITGPRAHSPSGSRR